MVSFWPWRGDDSSPASFEKTLSALSTKITDTQAKLERTRATSRRVRVLWMLYLSFAYLIYAIVLLLVVGYQNMGPWEWAGLGAGPVVISVTRTILALFFNFRIERISNRLKEYQDERAKTIQRLKDATKYDSTLQLLEKYGGGDGAPAAKGSKQQDAQDENEQDGRPPGRVPGRTNMPPPPTANIQRREGSQSASGTPQKGPGPAPNAPPTPSGPGGPVDFAPDTFVQPPPQHYASGEHLDTSHWYDRILDTLLGEDETAPKNRIVLICQSCRLVNGQAPPGTKSLVEVGTWKCMSCGASNGVMDEGKRLVKEVLGSQAGQKDSNDAGVGEAADAGSDSQEDEVLVESLNDDFEGESRATGGHNPAGARKRRTKKG